MGEYAVAITFPQNSTTYEALSKLSNATGFEIRSAAIVERDKDGHLHVPEGDDTMAGEGTVGGAQGNPRTEEAAAQGNRAVARGRAEGEVPQAVAHGPPGLH